MNDCSSCWGELRTNAKTDNIIHNDLNGSNMMALKIEDRGKIHSSLDYT